MIKIRNYTEEQIKFIAENYNSMTSEQIANIINKNPQGVGYVARKLGIIKQIHNKWTNEEIDFLKQNYFDMTSEEMANYVNHSIDSINSQRDRLKLVRNNVWTEEDVSFLMKNYKTMSHSEIGEILNRSEQAVRAKCFDLNLYKKELPWTKEEIEYVKNNYMETKTSDIAKFLGRTINAVKLKAEKMGFKKYPYSCDYHYFDIIDTEEKAYWLGFLTADGWISKNEKSNAGVVGCELQYSDIGHLKKFNKSILGNYQITDRWKPCQLSIKDKDKKYHECTIRIFSLTMYESLVRLGFTADKSYTFSMPEINKNLVRHYWRGYFDGDGCFTKTNKSFSVNFVTVSENLKNDILKFLKEINVNVQENTYINDNGTITYVPRINKYEDKIKFLDIIYGNCSVYLDRKYKKYLKVKEEQNKKHIT